MINYTDEQKEAISFIDNNLLISASAGSGKTQVLLEKVVYLIEKGYKLKDILMVTFTNLASNEMKSKLENMLTTKFEETGDEKFFNALKEINCSNISTIDSFCQKLVKQYYYFLNIEPNFEIKDENYINILKSQALNNTIEYYLQNKDEEFIKLSNLFVYKRDYDVFKNEIMSFYNFLISKPNKYEFIQNLINLSYNENLEENYLINKFINYVNENLSYYKKKLEEIKLSAEQIASNKLVDLTNIMLASITFYFKDFTSMQKTFINKLELPDIRISKNSEVEEVLVKEKLQEIKKQIKKMYDNFKEILSVDILKLNDDFKTSKNLLTKFVTVIETFENYFTKLKKQENILDFNDLETLSIKLLNNDEISNEIISNFKFIFVDEYQDTNSIQEEILKKLSKNCKRVMVGDLKQSIYAFRECNPQIFNDKMQNYKDGLNGKVIKLNKNFRSISPILEFSNNIFSNLMREENANYSYLLDGMFVCGKTDKFCDKNSIKPINILVNNKNSENKINTERNENILVLNAINNLLNQKIIENGVERNLTYKDIAIISRKRSEKLKNLCEFLSEYKVPTSVKYKEKIYQSFEVKLITSYLKLLYNFNEEISLVSVLKNLYDFTDNDLLIIKKDNLCVDLLEFNGENSIKNKINRFLSDYDYFKKLLGELSIKDLITEIINKTKLDLVMLKCYGKISAERIKVFINSLSDDLFSLKDFIESVSKTQNCNFEILKSDGENSVTIDTFHSTKGLEYNAVIIYSAGDRIFSINTSNLIYNASLGIGIYKFNEQEKSKEKDLIYSIIKILNKQEEFNEETRLSYVAFTRAKYFLTIIGSVNCGNLRKEENYIKFLDFNSYIGLIFSSRFETDDVEVKILNEDCEIFDKNEEKTIDNRTINLDFAVFDKYFSEQYKNIKSTNIQLKNSVTSLSEEDKPIYNISNFKLTDNDSEDYALIGNLYHYSLEKLPFNIQTKEELHNKLINLIENKLLPNNTIEYVDENKLLLAIKCMGKLSNNYVKIYKEKMFMLNIKYSDIFKNSNIDDKILIQGIIDLIIEKDDEIILVDYKTSRLNDINLIKKYALQLSLYETAIKNYFKNKKITKYIYSIFLDKLINIV